MHGELWCFFVAVQCINFFAIVLGNDHDLWETQHFSFDLDVNLLFHFMQFQHNFNCLSCMLSQEVHNFKMFEFPRASSLFLSSAKHFDNVMLHLFWKGLIQCNNDMSSCINLFQIRWNHGAWFMNVASQTHCQNHFLRTCSRMHKKTTMAIRLLLIFGFVQHIHTLDAWLLCCCGSHL